MTKGRCTKISNVLSGHPAISVPCGLANGLPVGLMFIARHFDECSALRAAAAFERLGNWKST
jgi:amidase